MLRLQILHGTLWGMQRCGPWVSWCKWWWRSKSSQSTWWTSSWMARQFEGHQQRQPVVDGWGGQLALVAPSFLADVIELFPFCFFCFGTIVELRLKSSKLATLTSWSCWPVCTSKGYMVNWLRKLGRLTTFRPLMPDVQRLCQKIQAEGAEALYSQGYIARKYQKWAVVMYEKKMLCPSHQKAQW